MRTEAAETVEAAGPELVALSHAIHAEPELAFEEHRSVAKIIEILAHAASRSVPASPTCRRRSPRRSAAATW